MITGGVSARIEQVSPERRRMAYTLDKVTRVFLKPWLLQGNEYDSKKRNYDKLMTAVEIVDYCVNIAWYLHDYTKPVVVAVGGYDSIRQHMLELLRDEYLPAIVKPLVLEGEISLSRGREIFHVNLGTFRDMVAQWIEEAEA